MTHPTGVAGLVVYLLIMLGIGLYASRRIPNGLFIHALRYENRLSLARLLSPKDN